MKVSECMTKATFCVKPDENIYDVAKLMGDNHIGCVPVCDNNDKIVGILTDRDIVLRGIACGKDAKQTRISEVMTTKVVRTSPDADINDVAHIMARNQIRRIPVVSDEKVVGIVSLKNLAQNSNIGQTNLGETLENICDTVGYHQD